MTEQQYTSAFDSLFPLSLFYCYPLHSLSVYAWSTLLCLSRGTMSVNDRRASYMSAPRPRVSSNRVGDARSGASPLQPEQINNRRSTSSQKGKVSREQRDIMGDKRAERMAPHSKDKAQVRARNPVKEPSSTGNREEWERSRSRRATLTDGASPNTRKKDKEPADC